MAGFDDHRFRQLLDGASDGARTKSRLLPRKGERGTPWIVWVGLVFAVALVAAVVWSIMS